MPTATASMLRLNNYTALSCGAFLWPLAVTPKPGITIRKTYINVVAEFTVSGGLVPLSISLYDGRCYPVDRVVGMQKAANRKVGGVGVRYVCEIGGAQRSLWREDDRWFVEGQVPDESA